MDKIAQAARQTRLAQALRTNLRRRKAVDEPRPDRDDGCDTARIQAGEPQAVETPSNSSEVESAT